MATRTCSSFSIVTAEAVTGEAASSAAPNHSEAVSFTGGNQRRYEGALQTKSIDSMITGADDLPEHTGHPLGSVKLANVRGCPFANGARILRESGQPDHEFH